ncbi:MAG: UDP-N-acetylmuramoyl-L-alanyl-D-glutamate--2,6-diaminopimelate ligase [Candidatus Epulonipiscioides saccharophilum]|nr:MAG: UDP-N-acetylmuramoyl-L-alanyl-D-glutamate--2,6-diaminopimelate ligase [Epulopiscium sp. AS2M-Bin001]
MELKKVLDGIEYELLQGEINREISDIIYDSRIKTKNGLFIAIKGFTSDGHKFIAGSISNGAKVIVVSENVEVEQNITVIKVKDSRATMARIANNFYGNPSMDLSLVGVTGTNGKTSTTFLLASILEAYNKKIGVIGTIENRIGTQVLETARTTPESLDLQKLFRKMNDQNVDVAIMEVSSHALELNRVDGCDFDIGAFTNLTQDHLDFHETMDNYAHAKAKLFKMCKTSVINVDSSYSQIMLDASKNESITYGIENPATFFATDIEIHAQETRYKLNYKGKEIQIVVPIPGKFTVYNTMCAIICAYKLGVPLDFIADHLKGAKGIPGRVQSFQSSKGYSVLVDYAHTPDGLENVLLAIKNFAKGNIITVFGCGGDRDNKKRPIMGEIATKYSDKVYITSDNPRSEEPDQIIKQIEIGAKKHSVSYEIEPDRKTAIVKALSLAKKDDVILIAGKGHETYQHLKDGIIHFDDSEVVSEFLAKE